MQVLGRMRSDRVLRRAVPPREPDTQRWQGLAAYVRDHPGHCPLGTPIAGRVEGRPWTTAIDYTQTRELARRWPRTVHQVLETPDAHLRDLRKDRSRCPR